MLIYLSADIVCFRKQTVFWVQSLRKIIYVSFEKQVMSNDKYLNIFLSQTEVPACIHYPFKKYQDLLFTCTCRRPCCTGTHVPVMYTCQLSRLRVENFNLTPTHACGPISDAWLKNVSCCHLAWRNFQKYVNSDPCKERKPCVKWINDNTFLAISDFWSEKHWERARVYTRPETGTSKCEGCFRFRHRRTSSEDFGILRKYSEMIVSFSKIPALPG